MKLFTKEGYYPIRRKSNRSSYAEYWNGFSWQKVSLGCNWLIKEGFRITSENEVVKQFSTVQLDK